MRSGSRKNRASRRGAVLVEYAFLLTAVAIPVVMGTVAGGVAMLRDYKMAQQVILLPIP